MSTSTDPMCSDCGRILSGGWFELLGGVRLCGLCYNKQFSAFKELRISNPLHPIDCNEQPNIKVTYCSNCGTYIRDQKYCSNCGFKIKWIDED